MGFALRNDPPVGVPGEDAGELERRLPAADSATGESFT